MTRMIPDFPDSRCGFRDRTGFSVRAGSVSEIADKVKLSSETVVRIAEVLNAVESMEITSQDLIDGLGFLRSANKFLSIWRRRICIHLRTEEEWK
ncbi:MAG: hypothetical protein ACLUOI_24090 [Eisenbergiella sp.]